MNFFQSIGGVPTVLAAIIVVAVATLYVIRFIRAGRVGDKATQADILKKVLFALVTEAERRLGAGTGALNASGVFQNIASGWTFTAKGILQYIDGTIEWSHSTDGRFEEVTA